MRNRATICKARLRPLGRAWVVMLALYSGVTGSAISVAAEPAVADRIDYFEKHVRPLLAEHCYVCHSAAGKTQGNLRLDTQSGWLAGGDSGPAIVPGKPDESLLVQAIQYDGGLLEMPPAGKLPDADIQTIRDWIARGAAAPADDGVARPRPAVAVDAGRTFWAYRPPVEPPITPLPDSDGLIEPIDRFILERLDAAGLKPAEQAAGETLVRRLYFDLLGLPPTESEIDAYLRDASPAAYEQLVDRLLASPHFGERWGRHWLDIVRFGESLTLRGFVLPQAWRYRDYVIDTFNQDLPYDQFLREQIAGDLLPADSIADRRRGVIATGFLALGNTNLEEQDKQQLDMDVVDEQLDVIGKAFLAQTIACARCHDHKFDPIPTRDYYALAGILRNVKLLDHENVSRWTEVPLPLPPEDEARLAAAEAAMAARAAAVDNARQRLAALAGDGGDGPSILPLASVPGIVIDDRQARKVGTWQDSQYSQRYIGDGYTHDQDAAKGEKTITFAPQLPADGRYEVRLAYTPGDNRADAVPVTVFSADGERTVSVDMRQSPPISGRFISLGVHRCEAAGQNFVLVSNEGTRGHVIADAVQYLPLDGDAPPPGPPVNGASAAEAAAQRDELRRLEAELQALRAALPERPKAMSIVERPQIADVAVHVRGSVHTLGEVVPRGFLSVISADPVPIPSHASGRRELADWLASADNPLTARVYVNRAWHWLFGAGLVRTVDNFGTTGEAPSHPDLLDHLALEFVADGWSVKRLVRRIVLSRTYRQASREDEAGLRLDPENRLLWRANRQRLPAECLRDAMLSAAGTLRLDLGGPTIAPGVSADYDYRHGGTRRSVYVPVLRNALPDIFEAFDFPDPSLVVGQRNTSTVAPQALLLMNHPFVREQAASAARRLLDEVPADEEARLTLAFRRILGRGPDDAERAVARRILADADPPRAWTDLVHVLFASLDFRYRD